MKKTVAILGCGPAGIFAAAAAEECGYDVFIVSKKRRSEMFGAQYLHESIPGINVEMREIEYRLLGTIENYRSRVYPGMLNVEVSVESLIGYQNAWDIRATYDILYRRFEDRISNAGSRGISGEVLDLAMSRKDWARYAFTINTIPLPSLCMKKDIHKFESQRIWAIGDAPARGIYCPEVIPKNKVLCNGNSLSESESWNAPSWYRASNVFGHTTLEWPSWHYPDVTPQAADVVKPLKTNCDCFPDVHMMGRYGRWEKGILSHQAYNDTLELLSA